MFVRHFQKNMLHRRIVLEILFLLRLQTVSTLFPYTTLFRSYVGFMVWSNFTATKCRGLVSLNQVIKEIKLEDRKSGSAGMPRPISYAVFCLKKKKPN